MFRLSQLAEGMHKIRQAEEVMDLYKVDSVVVGDDVGNDITVDREILKGAKGGLNGAVNEIIFDVEKDEKTYQWKRTVNEDMKQVVGHIMNSKL